LMLPKYSIRARNAFLPTSLLPLLHPLPCLFFFVSNRCEFHTQCLLLFDLTIQLILAVICVCMLSTFHSSPTHHLRRPFCSCFIQCSSFGTDMSCPHCMMDWSHHKAPAWRD
jgi:hypothetical protein